MKVLPKLLATLFVAHFAALKGHGFSRAANAAKGCEALAPEGCFFIVLLAHNTSYWRNL